MPVWCSAHCRDAAMARYHPVQCAHPVAALHRAAHGPPAGRLALAAAAQPGARTYALLLLKSFTMALVQHTHPLELAETKDLYASAVAVGRGRPVHWLGLGRERARPRGHPRGPRR